MTENVHRQENITRPWSQHLPKISERNVEDRKPMQHRSPIRTPNVAAPYASTVIATGGNVKDQSPDSSPNVTVCPYSPPNVTVVPPLYQLVLVAATEGSIYHVIVTAAFCDGRTTVTSAGNTTELVVSTGGKLV